MTSNEFLIRYKFFNLFLGQTGIGVRYVCYRAGSAVNECIFEAERTAPLLSDDLILCHVLSFGNFTSVGMNVRPYSLNKTCRRARNLYWGYSERLCCSIQEPAVPYHLVAILAH